MGHGERGRLSWARIAAAGGVVLTLLGAPRVASAAVPDDFDPAAVRQQVRDTSPSGDELRGTAMVSAASRLLRCFDLGGPSYCLGIGFTGSAQDSRRLTSELATRAAADDGHGGAMSAATFVQQRAALSDEDRVAAELAEIDVAIDGRDKAGDVAAQLTEQPRVTKPTNYIMYGYETRQNRSYWCGPATFQSIDWADDKQQDTQASWAADLGTTTGGTAITSMVKLTNSKTGWDVAAGAYIVQSVASWSSSQFFTVHRNHLGDADPAPVIEHPKLLRTYFPYLKYNHSGHFTVGRGYASSNSSISYFEVFNERDWNSSGNTTWGVRAVPAATLLAATKANTSFKNIGL
jgi:hypothetical protein